ncbi:MAG TPA: hypothetical protein VM370_10345 [Candidatus Thermoplasmatota archaeon]|nr:hypothetical protein [Candidatus Thermoplasmatota archaeon]
MLMELPASVKGEGPRMATLVEVGGILEAAQDEAPLSLAEIERRMSAKRVRHETLRASVDFLHRLGFVTLGSQGVQWTHQPHYKFWRAVSKGRSLL